MHDFPRFLTPEQAADLLPAFNAAWVRQQLQRGALPGYKVSNRWLIRADELEDFLCRHRTSPPPPRRRPRRRRAL